MPVYLRLFSEMTDAIGYLHKSKHMHRDLKPANVLLMYPPGSTDIKQLIVKVGDFGLAKNLDKTMQDLTSAGGSRTISRLRFWKECWGFLATYGL